MFAFKRVVTTFNYEALLPIVGCAWPEPTQSTRPELTCTSLTCVANHVSPDNCTHCDGSPPVRPPVQETEVLLRPRFCCELERKGDHATNWPVRSTIWGTCVEAAATADWRHTLLREDTHFGRWHRSKWHQAHRPCRARAKCKCVLDSQSVAVEPRRILPRSCKNQLATRQQIVGPIDDRNSTTSHYWSVRRMMRIAWMRQIHIPGRSRKWRQQEYQREMVDSIGCERIMCADVWVVRRRNIRASRPPRTKGLRSAAPSSVWQPTRQRRQLK